MNGTHPDDRPAPTHPTRRNPAALAVGAVLLAAALLAVMFLFSRTDDPTDVPVPAPNPANGGADNDPAKDAPAPSRPVPQGETRRG